MTVGFCSCMERLKRNSGTAVGALGRAACADVLLGVAGAAGAAALGVGLEGALRATRGSCAAGVGWEGVLVVACSVIFSSAS